MMSKDVQTGSENPRASRPTPTRAAAWYPQRLLLLVAVVFMASSERQAEARDDCPRGFEFASPKVKVCTCRPPKIIVEDGGQRFCADADKSTNKTRSFLPVATPLGKAAQISLGSEQSCAVLVDGTVKCWGQNPDGQLGDGSTTNRPVPTVVAGLTGVAEVALGAHHACARLTDGTVKCWGANSEGQLGDSTTSPHLQPTPVVGLAQVVEIAAGYRHSCARLSDGTVKCWGFNRYGQVGDGSMKDTPSAATGTERRATDIMSTPTTVAGLTRAASIGLGGLHSCARLTDGSVKCWGNNAVGQIGDGTNVHRGAPVAVVGLANVAEIALGPGQSTHTCARLTDGSLRCWGKNAAGQLGDGTQLDRLTAAVVQGVSGATGIAVNTAVTCARFGDGTAKCWGTNNFGGLGDGTTTSRGTPAAVSGLSNVAEIRVGEGHACARLADGSVSCWGANEAGQLAVTTSQTCGGNPAIPCSMTPVALK